MAVSEMAIHVAHLLRRSPSRRMRVYDIVKQGFKFRDMVVHGEQMKSKTHAPLLEFYSVLRDAIRTLVAHGPNIKKKNIEELAL